MPKKAPTAQPPKRAAASPSPSARSSPAPQPRAASAPVLKRPVPAASVAKAKEAFKNFSLSRFAGNSMPANYVAVGQGTAEVQQRIISRQIDRLKTANTPHTMTIAFPDATVKQLLPSLDAKAGTIDLDEVLKLLQQNMRGTEFYSYGNPTLSRLAIQSRVQQIIDSIKQDAQK